MTPASSVHTQLIAIRTRNKSYVVQVTGGRSAVLLGNGSIIFERRPRETGIREL